MGAQPLNFAYSEVRSVRRKPVPFQTSLNDKGRRYRPQQFGPDAATSGQRSLETAQQGADTLKCARVLIP